MDSSYLAYKLLTETSDDITLLAVVSESYKAEGIARNIVIAMQSLIAELKKIRSFKMEYVFADSTNVTTIEMDRWNTFPMYMFADKFNDGTYDKLVSGTTWEQCDGAFFKHSSVRGYPKHLDAQKIFSRLTNRGEIWNPMLTHDFYQNFGRWHAIKYLPEHIMSKTVTCTAGFVDSERCTRCDKCALKTSVERMMSKGATASDVDDWRRTKSLEYGGGTRDSGTQRWIQLEEYGFMKNTMKGIANDVDPNLVIPPIVETKEDFQKWYSTIEYVPALDWRLKLWGLDKTGWNPEEASLPSS